MRLHQMHHAQKHALVALQTQGQLLRPGLQNEALLALLLLLPLRLRCLPNQSRPANTGQNNGQPDGSNHARGTGPGGARHPMLKLLKRGKNKCHAPL